MRLCGRLLRSWGLQPLELLNPGFFHSSEEVSGAVAKRSRQGFAGRPPPDGRLTEATQDNLRTMLYEEAKQCVSCLWAHRVSLGVSDMIACQRVR